MIKITLIAPYPELVDLGIATFKEHNAYEAAEHKSLLLSEYEFEGFVGLHREVDTLQFDADVIIARGSTANRLKRRIKNLPVVEIPVAGIDLIRCLHVSKQRFGKQKVAVLGSKNMVFGTESLAEIVDLELHAYVIEDFEDMPSIVEEVQRQGYGVVIGGVTTTAYAKKLGMPALLLETGKESLWQAITEAKRAALISRMEQENARLFQSILDYTHEGIIAVDSEQRITVINAAAQKTLHLQLRQPVGKACEKVLPPSELATILTSHLEYFDHLVQYEQIQLAVNKVPIILKGENVGNVILFQDVTQIQELEGKIRNKLLARGHLAKHHFDDIIGKSPQIQERIDFAKRLSQIDSNILLLGETGTGKELFAQSIHNASQRHTGPFVAVNCAALPESLLESELFGYVKGAFTGALKEGKAGLFELAHGGTIFLDEISEISLKLQSRLLRVLQEKEIRRLGDEKVLPIDVRVISASNKDLHELVATGTFREDIYFRLDVLKIQLPALRDRREDIPLIAAHFIRNLCAAFHKPAIHLTPQAASLLQQMEFRGNIRELRNMCERLVVLSKSDMITQEEIETLFAMEGNQRRFPRTTPASGPPVSAEPEIPLHAPERLTREHIENALQHTKYNKVKAAKYLGIGRATLYRRLKEFNLQ
jgi:transcriptional regulator with PAS, ATPase and Fis domain